MTETEQLQQIREWYQRHKNDYDPVNENLPPQVWSEYFGLLLKWADRAISSRVTTK